MAQTNLSTEKKQTHGGGEWTCGCQGGQGRGSLGLLRCKLLHLEWISEDILLHGTESYI